MVHLPVSLKKNAQKTCRNLKPLNPAYTISKAHEQIICKKVCFPCTSQAVLGLHGIVVKCTDAIFFSQGGLIIDFTVLKFAISQSEAKSNVLISYVIIHQIFSLARDWSKRVTWANIPQLKLGNIRGYFRAKCRLLFIYQVIDLISRDIMVTPK